MNGWRSMPPRADLRAREDRQRAPAGPSRVVTSPIDSAMLITNPLWVSIIRVPDAGAPLGRRHDAHDRARVGAGEQARTRRR